MENDALNRYRVEIIPEPDTAETRRSGFVRFLLDVIETIVLSALLFAGINTVSARIRVDGHSMEPTLLNGEFVVVNKVAYKFGDPSRSDVIVFHYPRNPDQEYIKRIVGLPGDHIRIANGQVFVNDLPINEPYIAAPPNYQNEWIVPDDSLFVLGDNRNNSSDSHNWGPVPLEFVIGRAFFVYWPPGQWGLIEHEATVSAAP